MHLLFRATLGLLLLSLLGVRSAIANPSLTTSATDMAATLDLDGQGTASVHIVKVANITVSTDNPDGLRLVISSGSLSKSGGTDIPFQVTTVEDGSGPASAGDFTSSSGSNYSFNTSTAGTHDRDLYIRYSSAELQDPGHYSSSITITVLDN